MYITYFSIAKIFINPISYLTFRIENPLTYVAKHADSCTYGIMHFRGFIILISEVSEVGVIICFNILEDELGFAFIQSETFCDILSAASVVNVPIQTFFYGV